MIRVKKPFFRRLMPAVRVLLILLGACDMAEAARSAARNVIVMIVDGCSSEQYTFARWYKGGPLSLDDHLVGAVKTFTADSVVADSAPAASAFATGMRTSDKFISVGARDNTIEPVPEPPRDLHYKPLATVLEGARLLGKSTGIVATSRVSHATPAAYMAHAASRKRENDIMEQAVYGNLDVVFGGGMRHLIPQDAGGARTDGENLLQVLQQKGYEIADTRDEMMQVERGRVFGLFADSHMAAEIDRSQIAVQQPTLAEMTARAIEILAKNPHGFFLMVEASQVDWACHANDPAHLVSDLLMFDQAVETALDFARKDGGTLVLALSDHNTGGFSLGNYATSNSYSQMKPEALLRPIKNMKASAWLLWKLIAEDPSVENLKRVVKQGWEIDLTDRDVEQILALTEVYKEEPHHALGEVISRHYTQVGWSTHGHVGGDVPLFAYGPGKPAGLLDAPDIGRVTAAAMGLDLDELNRRLFTEASAFPGVTLTIDKTRKENPVITVAYQGITAQFPANKNLIKVGDKVTELEGVVVYLPETGKAYLPLQALRTMGGSTQPLPSVAAR